MASLKLSDCNWIASIDRRKGFKQLIRGKKQVFDVNRNDEIVCHDEINSGLCTGYTTRTKFSKFELEC